ncbi:magnesium transporter CorA family protein [Patescibacteria group bacterium]|nr:magnesium transporter CorA family protein [Patescibacteria group bacterium]
MIKIYKKTVKEAELTEVNDFILGSWVRVVDPTQEEVQLLADKTGIALDILEDAVDEAELPRIEYDQGNLVAIIRVPVSNGDGVTSIPLTIIITNRYIVTISIKSNEIIKLFLENKIECFTTQKSKFLLKILDQTNRSYDKLIKGISKNISRQKYKLDSLKNKDIFNLVQQEEVLNNFISSLVPNSNVFDRILKGKYLKLYEQDEELVEDLLIDVRQVIDLCNTNIKTIKNVREAYQTILSNNLNKLLKFLTSITIILTLPTIIASIYGMNVELPGGGSHFAFYYIAGFTIIVMAAAYAIFNWKKWL